MKALRVLSLDGGGLRGIFTLRLLEAIERLCGRRIQEIFDYCIGTSTGGIIALALFHAKMSVSETMALYERLGRDAFVKWVLSSSPHRYDHKKLEKLLQAEFGAADLGSQTDPYVAVVAHRWDRTPNRLAVFANYSLDKEPFEHAGLGVPVWAAARATSAAPTFFQPCTVDRRQYVDGGLVANNPVLVGFAEASQLGDVTCVVSVGTGKRPTDVALKKNCPFVWDLAHDLVEGSLEASSHLQHTVADAFFDYLAVPFLRLDGKISHQIIHDASKMSSWIAAADELLYDVGDKLAAFCNDHLGGMVPSPPSRVSSDDEGELKDPFLLREEDASHEDARPSSPTVTVDEVADNNHAIILQEEEEEDSPEIHGRSGRRREARTWKPPNTKHTDVPTDDETPLDS